MRNWSLSVARTAFVSVSVSVALPIIGASSSLPLKSSPPKSSLSSSMSSGSQRRNSTGAANKVGIFADHISLLNGQSVIDRFPLEDPMTARPSAVTFRRNNLFVVWDARGLTINNGKTSFSTRLEGIPVSPRLRQRDDILKTLDGRWALTASGLSGGRRFGPFVYMIARWQRPGSPQLVTWLETLLRINLTVPDPRPEALAVVEGVSFSSRPIEDNLTVRDDRLVMPVRHGTDWGIWSYDPSTQESTFARVGTGVKFAKALSDGTIGFVEKTATGSFLAGTYDPSSLQRHEDIEANDPLRFVDLQTPSLVRTLTAGDSERLYWLEEGRTLMVPNAAQIRRGKLAVGVWIGETIPTRAWVYGVKSATLLAVWPSAAPDVVVDGGAPL